MLVSPCVSSFSKTCILWSVHISVRFFYVPLMIRVGPEPTLRDDGIERMAGWSSLSGLCWVGGERIKNLLLSATIVNGNKKRVTTESGKITVSLVSLSLPLLHTSVLQTQEFYYFTHFT